ncbi:LuxR family transcriptional regulator [Fulvimarina endophytica]|uniref:LuxR family transcriptional regulator n=1 Tax=Fulvimarina endophytica TaxID=2293836 RepID=A0A371X2B5_9HYPH|nr:LuxR family transcriptional regulator [Fulvimarina endophytica]RFC63371.1 LuxR family transcriptional regulator [Fulvimarina endophytica]
MPRSLNCETLLSAVQSAQSVESAIRQLSMLLNGLHVTCHLAQSAVDTIDWPYLRTTYPQNWISHYLLNGYARVDPVVAAGFTRTFPFEWSELEVVGEAMAFFEDARIHGVGPDGYSVPIVDRTGRRGLVSVGDSEQCDWPDAFDNATVVLPKVAHALHAKAVAEAFGPMLEVSLSPRERDVLALAAKGRSSKAIALELGVSEHTVRGYQKSARHKLNGVSIAQAVSIALKRRLI